MEADITDLRSKLKECENERLKAAQYGLQLLERQTELQNQLDKCHEEMMSMTENYNQEKYALQREVELKNRMLESLSCECETLKQQQKMQLEQLEVQLNRSHRQEVNDLKNKLEKLKVELDESRLSEKQLKQKLDHQKDILAHKSEELRLMSEQRKLNSTSSEMLALQMELTEMEGVKTALKEEVNELQYKQEQLECLNTSLMHQVDRLKEEKEEREKEAVSYYNALEKARIENQDLQVQLDNALQQASDPSSKGNSLFAEVEDRRMAMECQLNLMKVKYQSMKKQNAFTRDQMNKMKVQISTLLRMRGSQTDFEQQERLFAMLEQKNGEIKHLLGEIKNLEKFKHLYESMESKPSTSASPCTLDDSTYYADLLQLKLDKLNKENEDTKGELSIQRMKALFESQRALDIERKLFANERHLQLSESENIKLRAKLDELKLKYEPEEKIEVPVLKKRREVLPLDISTPTPAAVDATGEEVSRLPLQRDEKESYLNSINDNPVQWQQPATSAVHPVSLSPCKTPPPDTQLKKKCVKLVDSPANADALREQSGNTPRSPRLTAESRLPTEVKESKETTSKPEKGAYKKSHTIMYVSAKSTPETQCPQQ
ncbi:protein Spindly [Phodopus roborovskii]|uniref:Protein Spindly n=1 Tax=Phodopus roborovskii TaxID=109678 RepID=A0AAU9Z3Z2_PHORO|nr:protein Spindly [Phodopus roborovskii]XP_051036918.1 protein Spindly [Phodopus roborovskii]CAH6786513.1 Spdl1 [Phodopus roborovskii]